MKIYAEHDTYGDLMYGVNFYLYDIKEWMFAIVLHPDRASFLNAMNDDDSQDSMPITDWCDDPEELEQALHNNIIQYNEHENDEDFDCRVLENRLLGHIVSDENLFLREIGRAHV